MTLRDQIRRVRLFYKAMPHVFSVLRRPLAALWLPVRRSEARFESKRGVAVVVPAGDWDLLPNMCRLAEIGASCRIEGDVKRIEIDGITLYSPKEARVEGDFFREIFREDVYRLQGRPLTGKTVVDIGAFIGDSTIVLARQGATVYAIEPSARLGRLFVRNMEANRIADRVVFLNVGLSNATRREQTPSDSFEWVEGIDYVRRHLPRDVEFLKMDCEGCEYALLADDAFLDHLNPAEVSMEYHHGAEPLVEVLQRRNYHVEAVSCDERVGYIYARRIAA